MDPRRRRRSRVLIGGGLAHRIVRHVRQAAGHRHHAGGDLPGPAGAAWCCWSSRRSPPASRWSLTGDALCAYLLLAVGLVLGVLLVLPIGGADVPIVISLLNAFTGLAVAASGLVLSNVLLLIAGTLVGASGTILTMAMAKAMGRTVAGIVFGAFRAHVASSTSAGRFGPAGAHDGGRRRRDPARLRAAGRHRARLRARRRRRPPRRGRARRDPAGSGRRRRVRHPPRRRPDAGAHERAARRGERALRRARRDGRGQPAVQDHRPRAGRRARTTS